MCPCPLPKFRTSDFRPALFIARGSHGPAMGWITRRIAGSVTFVIVSAILSAWAIATGHLSGEPTLTTAWGAGMSRFRVSHVPGGYTPHEGPGPDSEGVG